MESEPYGDPYAGGPPPNSRAAVASLVCAFLCQPVGIVLGIIALVNISKSQGRLGGQGLAIAGLVISCVVAVLIVPFSAMVAAVAIPSVLRSRVAANETSARASLKTICMGQEQFRMARCVDQDQDAEGEYGFLGELAGTSPCRGSGQALASSPYVPSFLGRTDARGVAVRNGYCFVVYLPDGRGGFRFEAAEEPYPEAADAQETGYVAYTWPLDRSSGKAMLVMDPQGLVHERSPSPCFGRDDPPAWDEAYEDTDGSGAVEPGQDGFRAGWTPQG